MWEVDIPLVCTFPRTFPHYLSPLPRHATPPAPINPFLPRLISRSSLAHYVISRMSQNGPSSKSPKPGKPVPITLLSDNNQPFIFEISAARQPFRFQFYDTSCPEDWTNITPNLIVLCYDISSRLSLINAQRLVTFPFIFHPSLTMVTFHVFLSYTRKYTNSPSPDSGPQLSQHTTLPS